MGKSKNTVAGSSKPKKTLRGPVMLDLQGTRLTDQDRQRFMHPLVGGVILFTRNFESREQLAKLTRQIHRLRRPRLLIAVDHEGGRVQRFKGDGFTHLPPMAALGGLWMKEPLRAMSVATSAGVVLAAELRACGVDLSFTPVLDLDYGVSDVIGDRSFHRDPRVVAMLARALVQGMSMMGMGACGKHFPGHGAVTQDSHHEIPTDPRTLNRILKEDGAPYAWLGNMVIPSVMPAHVIYPKVDDQPAGFSRRWIQEILRQRLGYDGVVFSDDLTMEAASVAGDITARAQAALSAGCDMVLVCNREDLADELLGHLVHTSDVASVARIERLMPKVKAMRWPTLMASPTYLQALGHLKTLDDRT
jgi:beta-N-acetylhexosaminidase